jgi:carbon monoxide dehydrogenase subunit G
MFKFKKSYYIDRPQQQVFDYATNPTNDTQWRESAVSSEWESDGPVGVGSKLHSVDKLMGRNIESRLEISAWDPPKLYGQKSVGGAMPFEMTFRLEPEGNGTRINVEGQAEIGGLFKIAEGLAGKQLEKQLDTDFNGLKRVLEAG